MTNWESSSTMTEQISWWCWWLEEMGLSLGDALGYMELIEDWDLGSGLESIIDGVNQWQKHRIALLLGMALAGLFDEGHGGWSLAEEVPVISPIWYKNWVLTAFCNAWKYTGLCRAEKWSLRLAGLKNHLTELTPTGLLLLATLLAGWQSGFHGAGQWVQVQIIMNII